MWQPTWLPLQTFVQDTNYCHHSWDHEQFCLRGPNWCHPVGLQRGFRQGAPLLSATQAGCLRYKEQQPHLDWVFPLQTKAEGITGRHTLAPSRHNIRCPAGNGPRTTTFPYPHHQRSAWLHPFAIHRTLCRWLSAFQENNQRDHKKLQDNLSSLEQWDKVQQVEFNPNKRTVLRVMLNKAKKTLQTMYILHSQALSTTNDSKHHRVIFTNN